MSDVLLHIRNLSVGYGDTQLVRVDDAIVRRGELIGMIGRNGSGKSTLLRTILGLIPSLSGEVILSGSDVTHLSPAERAKRISAVFARQPEVPALPVTALVALGRFPHRGSQGYRHEEDEHRAREILKEMDVEYLADRMTTGLSDGELQKVMIARAMVQEAPLLILDEPAAFLDFQSREELMILLRKLSAERGIGVLMTSHDLDLVHRYTDHRWEIRDGKCHC